MGKIPKEIRCDNEASLITLPHDKIIPNPPGHPQSNAMVERVHREIGNLCRTHDTTPEKVEAMLKYNIDKSDELPLGDILAANPGLTGRQDTKTTGYDGRTLEIGDLVFSKDIRERKPKTDPPYLGPFRVTEKKGDKTYVIRDGETTYVRHVDHLKKFNVESAGMFDGTLKLTDQIWRGAIRKPKEMESVTLETLQEKKGDFAGAIYLGYVGLERIEKAVNLLKRKNFKVALLSYAK